ncbi:DUF1707 SHOCT-like domain-containing protein [Rhodoflexus caldus]|uniref:DUF1707 SHOCT-like domain-containing protein n=1 Tax=Rhodoflexus caldus TaxID=2891236 RepID=UPI002029D9C7|nr:DUF1707 domain-containing protein [Rhodoflexus caldus]
MSRPASHTPTATKTIYGLPKKMEEVIQALQTAFAEQNLDEREYERRLQEAMKAECIEDLEPVLSDFPKAIRHKIFPPAQQQPQFVQETPYDYPANSSQMPNGMLQTIFNNDKQEIAVLDERPVKCTALFGTQKIDFRTAQVVGNQFRIHIESYFSETTIDLRNEAIAGKHLDIVITGGLSAVKILLPPVPTIQRAVQLVLSEFQVKDKRRSWLDRLTGKPAPLSNESPCIVQVRGNFFLGEIQVQY